MVGGGRWEGGASAVLRCSRGEQRCHHTTPPCTCSYQGSPRAFWRMRWCGQTCAPEPRRWHALTGIETSQLQSPVRASSRLLASIEAPLDHAEPMASLGGGLVRGHGAQARMRARARARARAQARACSVGGGQQDRQPHRRKRPAYCTPTAPEHCFWSRSSSSPRERRPRQPL